MINPVGPGQTISNMINIREDVKKVQEYLDIVKSDLGVVREHIPALLETPEVSGLLLFREPMPLPLERDQRVAMANWFSLRRFLSEGGYQNLRGLVEWIKGRPDLKIAPGSYGLNDYRISVGEWQYVRERIYEMRYDERE